jgi:hypothetical protein
MYAMVFEARRGALIRAGCIIILSLSCFLVNTIGITPTAPCGHPPRLALLQVTVMTSQMLRHLRLSLHQACVAMAFHLL